jgi:translocation and assembly module TamB
MMIALSNVVVEANDGGPPFLRVERLAVRPRPFSLLAGQLDVGEVEIDRPWIRAVVQDGALTNLDYKLPPSESKPSKNLPFTSLAVTEARIDLTVDTAHVLTEELDADVSAEEDGAIEAGLRAAGASITRVHPMPSYPSEDAVDEDSLCKLDLRARIEEGQILVRRLSLAGTADFDPDPGTALGCSLPKGDWRAFEASLSAVRVSGLSAAGLIGGQLLGSGRVHAKVPVALAHRFVKAPHLSGSLTLDVEVEYDGGKLPRVTGSIEADSPGADGKLFAETLQAQLDVTDAAVRLSKIEAVWGGGKVAIAEAKVEPFAKGRPLTAGPVVLTGVQLADLVRDLGVHPQATAAWTLRETHVPEFKGTLEPLDLSGALTAQTEGFQVFDRSVRNPARKRMIGLPEALVRGTLAIRPEGVAFQGFTVDSPRTHLKSTVMIEFKNRISLDIAEGSTVDLAEVGPLVDIPISGLATVKAVMRGPLSKPKLTGELSIDKFVFGGLEVGQIESAKAEFEPLVLTLTEARVRKNGSLVRASRARFAFDEGPQVVADADIDTRESPHLEVRDLLEVFRMDKIEHEGRMVLDPRWAEIKARASGGAHLHFVVGGREDRCGGGFLRVDGDLDLFQTELFGEKYDGGSVDFGLAWDDRSAGANGMRLDVRSAILRKGDGAITATASVRHGGVLRAQAVASGIPIGSLDVVKPWGSKFDGSISAIARIGGTLDAMDGLIAVEVSRVRVGPSTLPPSQLTVQIVPRAPTGSKPPPLATPAVSLPGDVNAAENKPKVNADVGCRNRTGAPFNYAMHLRDLSQGDYVVDGMLFGDQVALRDVKVSQQRRKVVRGTVESKDLDLGALANLIPGVAFSAAPPDGKLSAVLDIREAPLADIAKSKMSLVLSKLSLGRGGQTLKLLAQTLPITVSDNRLTVPGLRLEGRTASGFSATVIAQGKVDRVLTSPSLDVGVRVEPLSLTKLSADIPGVERASGTVDAQLRMLGPLDALAYSGAARLKNGELYVKGLPVGLTDVQVDIDVGAGDVRIKKATAKVGTGTLSVTGGIPIHGTSFGTATAKIVARGVKLPVADGVQLTADADLEATLRPDAEDSDQRLPDVKGTVALTSFSYTRPIELAVNLGQLGARSRTAVETYDPKKDALRFELSVVSPKPLRFVNNLVDMQLEVVEPGLVLSGTNQRFGARGLLRIRPESKLRLRNTEFEVREGSVRFDDPFRIAPKVDVRATTEYRRSSTLTGPAAPAPEGGGTTTTTGGAQGAQAGGLWRIGMHAYGNAEALKVDLSSDPALSQEDIVLLLTFGLTRAEIDQGLASSVGETVGLEALSALTGADKAVKNFVPLIDEFRFGTAYSSRAQRTQAMVTVGKRITDSVRATVTTGITENREVKSTIEWKLDRGVSVQGSYDNSSETFGVPIGNLGADLRWRIEFE